ncbi:MAG: hydroxymethylglutaryl-CoA reductase [Candidatus Marsarchaeota archaeon]|nr:hydroxymethylglutaryl-CoA reductase [Candidatus Marsarchaeota archaeon]
MAAEIDSIVEKMLSGELKPHAAAEAAGGEKAASEARRIYLERKYSSKLDFIKEADCDLEDAGKRNIENAIGTIKMPLGFVELLLGGRSVPVFLATTEGKLVAGINRGASAINSCGGAKVTILKNAMTRSVIIETSGAADSARIAAFISSADGKKVIRDSFALSSKRLELLDIETYATGRFLFVRYSADTKAAMGMNMLTIATTEATKSLAEALGARGVAVRFLSESGNMCSDKKAAMINVIRGRGISVIADAVITKEALERYFKTDAAAISELNYAKNYMGAALAGAIAHNAHAANMLAALFIAYGQDPAQVVDGANAVDDAKAMENGDLYISVYLPSLEIGTFGGGTVRETQKELLKASGVYGEGDESGATKLRFAEMIAATVLAGELNLLAAQARHELASAHQSLKR